MTEWFEQPAIDQSRADQNFPNEITEKSWGETLRSCIQCGNCTGTCPLSDIMDYGPRRIIAMIRAGFRDEVLKSNTPWICASCYECTVECPKEIKITDVMYALKQRALEAGTVPAGNYNPVLAKEFFNLVMKRGRNNEVFLMMFTVLKTNWFKGLDLAPVGIKLLAQGRMPIFEAGIQMGTGKKGDLKKILDACEVCEN